MLESLAGAQLAHDVGYLEGGMCNSIEQIVICDELIAYTRHFMRGLEINAETLALDLIDEIGPDGDYLAADHTLQHFREDWYPKLFDRRSHSDWQAAGGLTLRQRAQKKALKILDAHHPDPMPAEIIAQLDAVIASPTPP